MQKVTDYITRVVTGPIETNTYIIETSPPIVVDPGTGISQYVKKPCVVLLTHTHYDHICGLAEINVQKVYVSKEDLAGLRDPNMNLSRVFGVEFSWSGEYQLFESEMSISGLKFQVLSTPGHTKGSVVLMLENVFFTGDTIFLNSIGRVDFPSSSRKKMKESIAKLLTVFRGVDPEAIVLPGHMEWGSVHQLLRLNPFFKVVES